MNQTFGAEQYAGDVRVRNLDTQVCNGTARALYGYSRSRHVAAMYGSYLFRYFAPGQECDLRLYLAVRGSILGEDSREGEEHE